MQAWDKVGQCAVEMANDSDGAKSFNKNEDFVPFAMAITSITDSYQEKLSFEALRGVSSSRLLREAERFRRYYLHLSFLTHTFSCPQEEP